MAKSILRFLVVFSAVVASLSVAGAASSYPNRLIRIIVPFPAGGLNDNVARIIQPSLQEELGQTIIIENRTGASGIIGTDAVAKAARDGYTLLIVASSHTVSPATNTKLPYDTEPDFGSLSAILCRQRLCPTSSHWQNRSRQNSTMQRLVPQASRI